MQSVKIIRHSSSKDVIIFFSARDVRRGNFTFWNVANKLPANAILINDYSNGWYLNGTPEFENEENLSAWLRTEILKITAGYGKVYTIGSSMGAYAALKYGAKLRVDRILAFGPESELCIPFGRSVTSLLDHAEGDGDISNLSYKTPEGVLIISGNNDLVDFYCACKFKSGNNDVDVVLINNETHVVAKFVEEKLGIYNVVFDFLLKGKKGFVAKLPQGKVVSLDLAISIKTFNENLLKKIVSVECLPAIEAVALSQPNWSIIQYLYGCGLIHQNRLEEGRHAFEMALISQPTLARARLSLGKAKYASGMRAEAIKDLEFIAETNLTYSVADLLHKYYLDEGRTFDAIQMLRRTMTLEINSTQKSIVENKISEIEAHVSKI